MTQQHPARFRLQLSSLRWLVALVPIIGFLITQEGLGEFAADYMAWTLLATGCAGVIIWRVRHDWLRALPQLALFSLFIVGYFVQFFWSILTPDSLEEIYWELPVVVSEPGVLSESYEIINLGFLGLTLGTVLTLGLRQAKAASPAQLPQPVASDDQRRHFERVSLVLLFVTPALMLGSGLAMFAYGIAVSGAQSVYLPFRASGIIYYTHAMVVPALLCLLVWCTDVAGLRRRMQLGVALVLLHGLTGMMLRSSRGVLLMVAALLFIVMLVSGRLTWKRFAPILAFGLLMGLLWPLFTIYRNVRVVDPAMGPLAALSESLGSLFGGSEALSETFSSGMENTVRRIGNVYSVMLLAWKQTAPVGLKSVFIGGLDLGRYFTVEVLGYPADAPHSSATSLLGWFYLVGGKPLVVVGMACFAAFVAGLWRGLALLKLRTLPVARSMMIFWLALTALEGALDRLALSMLTLAAAVAVPELVLRLASPRRRRHVSPHGGLPASQRRATPAAPTSPA